MIVGVFKLAVMFVVVIVIVMIVTVAVVPMGMIVGIDVRSRWDAAVRHGRSQGSQ